MGTRETPPVAWLALRRYASSSTWIGPSFSDAPIWLATLLHHGDASLTTRALSALRAFLAERHEATPQSPADLQSLRASSAITVSVGAARDDVGLGVSNAALGLYVEGDERAFRNLLALLHEYIGFRARHTGEFAVETVPPLLLEVFVPQALDMVDTVGRFTAVETKCVVTNAIPIDVFAAPPPGICNGLLLQVEWSGDYQWFHGTLSGYTWPFRHELQRDHIEGRRDETTENYYRVWPRCDIDEFGESVRYDDIRSVCLQNAPLRLLLTETAPAHTRARLFVVRAEADPSVSVRLAHTDHEPYDSRRLARSVQERRNEFRGGGAVTGAAQSSAGAEAESSTQRSAEGGDVKSEIADKDSAPAVVIQAAAAVKRDDSVVRVPAAEVTGPYEGPSSSRCSVDETQPDSTQCAKEEERPPPEGSGAASARRRSPSRNAAAARALAAASGATPVAQPDTEAEAREASPNHELRIWKRTRSMLSGDPISETEDAETERLTTHQA